MSCAVNPESESKICHKLVLTGGSCGGKTIGISRLCTFFENLGWRVFRVPETANVLLSAGIKFIDLTVDEDCNHHVTKDSSPSYSECTLSFQSLFSHQEGISMAKLSKEGAVDTESIFKFLENLLRCMIEIEQTFFQLAKSCDRNCLIICARGTMDVSTFLTRDKWEKMMEANGWNTVELRDKRYNQIIHMVSAAKGAEDFFATEDHACRDERLEVAQKLDDKAAAAWIGHPYFDVIDNSSDFESKICRVIAAVCQKLSIDVGDQLKIVSKKRKFLVKSPLPEGEFTERYQDFHFVYHYLQSARPQVQSCLRKRGQKSHWSYSLTVRNHHRKDEVNSELTREEYFDMLQQKDDSHFAIFKKRRYFIHNNQYFYLDLYMEAYHPRCDGLILMKTFSILENDELISRLPKFLTIIKEVTADPDYSMFNLSLKGDWHEGARYRTNWHQDDTQTHNTLPLYNSSDTAFNGLKPTSN